MCDPELVVLLKTAEREKTEITELGVSAATQAKAKPLYNSLKKAIKHKQARSTVLLTPNKNPYEAWRLLHQKYAPRNDARAGAIVLNIVDWKSWKCNTRKDVPTTIMAWEKLQDEYRRQYHCDPINDPLGKRC